MDQKALILFQMAYQHTFFKDGLVKGLACGLTASALRQLSGIKGHYHSYHGGGAVVYPVRVQKSGSSTPSTITANANLTISLEITEADFINYTDLQDRKEGKTWYANNLGDTDEPAELDLVDIKGPQFTLDFTGQFPTPADTKRQLKITRPNGEVIADKTWYTTPADPLCPVDVRGQTDGCYRLQFRVGTKTFKRTFFKYDQGLKGNMFGFFEWFATQNAKSGTLTKAGIRYTLQFNARQTYWQYYLVRNNGIPFKNPSIAPVVVSGKTVRFTQTATNVLLPNGKQATEFTSDQMLPLAEVPKMEIMLEATGLAKGMQLPYASPDLLYTASTAAQRSSKIYVYF
jgi:hypothetical protein